MRKTLPSVIIMISLYACSNSSTDHQMEGHNHDSATTTPKDTSKKSIPSEARAQVGNTDVKINYHAPGVRGRIIWGGLVPYDAVWVTGAHSATTMEVGKSFRIGDKTIPAGKYALFTIPGKEEWIIIINRNWNQHLADDYSETEDLVRVKARPEVSADLTERLKYEVQPTGEKTANITISWEKLRIPFQMTIVE